MAARRGSWRPLVAGRARRAAPRVLRGLAALGFAFGVSSGALACGGAAEGPPPEAPAAEAPRPPPRDAALVAEALARGQVAVLLHADPLRNHPLGPKLAAMPVLARLLEGTGIDPLADLDRAFVTAPSASSGASVFVAEHHVDPARLEAALDVLVARSDPPGRRRDDLGMPAVEVRLRGHDRLVAAPTPTILVALPPELAAGLRRFSKTGGLPLADGDEAALLFAKRPSETLRARGAPRFPDSVSSARLDLGLAADGGADLALVAESGSEAQARDDARRMQRDVERATTFKVAFIRVRVFKPVAFRSEGSRVLSDVHLTPAEIDRLLGFARMLGG